MKKIKGIIFDLGGVILDIDYSATEKAFVEHGAKNFQSIYKQSDQAAIFDQFEEGYISASEFRSYVMNLLNLNLTEKEFDMAWNKMLLHFQKDRMDLLRHCKNQGLKIFLYSNIDEIHLPDVEIIAQRDLGLANYHSLFDKIYYSHHFKNRKPYTKSFEALCNDIDKNFHIKKEELLFIDDTIKHVHGARSVGLKALHIKSNLTTDQLCHEIYLILNPLRAS